MHIYSDWLRMMRGTFQKQMMEDHYIIQPILFHLNNLILMNLQIPLAKLAKRYMKEREDSNEEKMTFL